VPTALATNIVVVALSWSRKGREAKLPRYTGSDSAAPTSMTPGLALSGRVDVEGAEVIVVGGVALVPWLPVADGAGVPDGVVDADSEGAGDLVAAVNCSRRLLMVGALRVTFAALRRPTVDSHPAALRARAPTVTSPPWLVKGMRSTTPDKLELPLNRVRGEATAPFADSVTNLKVRVSFPPPSSVHPCVAKWNLQPSKHKHLAVGDI
jgi:hypothetical protein